MKLLVAGNAPHQPTSLVMLCGFPGCCFVCFYLFCSKIFVKSSGNANGFIATVPGTRLLSASWCIAAGALPGTSCASCAVLSHSMLSQPCVRAGTLPGCPSPAKAEHPIRLTHEQLALMLQALASRG